MSPTTPVCETCGDRKGYVRGASLRDGYTEVACSTGAHYFDVPTASLENRRNW